jgi:O-antigen/teichoic acid export membrane protein
MSSPAAPRSSYLINIIWSWMSVVAILLSGFILLPIVYRRLGAAQTGMWTLALAQIEYFWMIDLGFRPATVKYSAEFRALGQLDRVTQLVNTALTYSTGAGFTLFLIAWFNAARLATFLHVDSPDFVFLIRVVGLSWAAGLPVNIFAATLEGFQRFDLSNHSAIATSLLRSVLSVVLVTHGYGLRELGITLLISQVVGYLMTYVYFRHVYPSFEFSARHVRWPMVRLVLNYARQILPGIVGARLSSSSLPAVITYFKSTAFVPFFSQTQRILDYVADAISRVGWVTSPRATAMYALGKQAEVVELTRTANRYCLTLWGLAASFLAVYGGDFFRVWITKEFGDQAALVLPWFLLGYTFWMGQFISAAVLMGIAHYARYSYTLLIEAIAAIVLTAILLPTLGLIASVAGIAILMILARCIVLSYLFCQKFEISQVRYLADIFVKPMLLIGSCIAALVAFRMIWHGDSWIHLIAAGAVFAPVYCALAFFFVVDPTHRLWALSQVRSRWARLRGLPVSA